jgi:hypothetical protein
LTVAHPLILEEAAQDSEEPANGSARSKGKHSNVSATRPQGCRSLDPRPLCLQYARRFWI